MALIMTLSLLPTAAFAAFGNGETNTIDASTVALAPTRNHVADGTIEGTNTKFSLLFSINSKEVSKPGERVNVTAYADLEEGSGDDVKMTKVSLTDNKTTHGDKSWAQTKESSILGYPKVGDDGSADFTISVEYVVNGTTTGSKSVRVVIKNLWTGYNVTYTQGADETFTGVPATPAKTVAKDASSGVYEQVYTIPADATASKDGYTFEGWQVSDIGSLPAGVVSSGTMIDGITSDITLKANLVKNQEISFDPVYSGVSGLPYLLKATSTGSTYNIPYTPQLANYTFDGWSVTGGAGSTAKIDTADPNKVIDINAPITLTPKWVPAGGTTPVGSHSVKFVRNNATDGSALNWPDNLTGAKDSTVTIPWLIPQAEGYTFLGWSTTENATTADPDYAYGKEVMIGDTDTSLYAVWRENMVSITYPTSLAGGKVTPGASSVKPGASVTFSVLIATGYDASSVNVTANGIGLGAVNKTTAQNGVTTLTYTFNPTVDTTILVSAPKKLTYNVTLPISDKVDVSFTNPASDAKSMTVNYGSDVAFKVAARTGYTVKGVYANGQKLKEENGAYTIKDITVDQRVTVDVEAIQFHKVTYVVLDKTYLVQDVQHSQTSTVENPVVEGYTFMGWNTKQDGSGDTFNSTTTVNGNITVYAQLQAVTHQINYDLNAPQDANGNSLTVNPSTLPDTEKTYGKAVTLSAVMPTCDGYDFLGWAKARDSKTVVYAAGATVSEELTADMTLYAVWAKKTYTITLQGGSGYTVSSNQALVVEHGSTFTFTVTVDGAYAATEPTVTISSTANGTLTKTDGNHNSEHKAATYTYTISNVTADQVVTVKVTENARATVTFQYRVVDAQGNEVTVTGLSGETFMTQAVQLGDPAAQPQQPNIEGYKFVRWCGADHTTATHEAYDFTKPVADELTIYAEITPILPVITVTNALSGLGWKTENWQYGTETMTNADTTNKSFTIAYGDNVTFDLVIAKGYDYSKLSVTANGLALGYQSATTDEKTGVTTLHYYLGSVMADTRIAITGIERKTITINYFANAGDDVASVPGPQTDVKYYINETGVENSNIINFTPVRTGYNFLGWCENPAPTGKKEHNANGKLVKFGENAVYQPGDTATFTKDTNLYAIWEATELKVDLTFSDTALHTDAYDIQYEGKTFTLNAQLNARAKGSMIFKMGTTDSIDDAKEIGRVSNINGDSASLTVTTDKYITPANNNLKYYWVEFQAEKDEGFTDCKAGPIKLKIFSRAITWASLEKGNDNTLTIKQGNETRDSMIAGQTYTLAVDTSKITGLETLDSKQPVLGKDYKIVWQYKKTATSDWETVNGEFTDTNEYQVTPAESGYEFRAKIYPMGDLYNTAAKFDADGKYLDNQYDSCLYTNTTKSNHQVTATALTIDAPEESKDIKINGTTPFTNNHLAQFEGQAVTLTAKVTKDGGNNGVEIGYVKFYRHVDGTNDTLLNTTLISVDANGIATLEVKVSAWDTAKDAAQNLDQFYAVYETNETYETSKSDSEDVYIKSAKLMTPIIESTLAGTLNGTVANSTSYEHDLIGLLAGVQHTFKLRQDADQTAKDYSVVALDGRTVDATNYAIKWLKTTGSNEQEVDATGTNQIKVDENKVGDRYRVKLTGKGVFADSEATSQDAVIGTKQDVTVTVKALDVIESTAATDVYQLNEITLTATVAAAKGADATMKPTGTVTFYYLEEGATNKWIELGTSTLTKDAQSTQGEMIATIQTTKLPVSKTTYTSLPSKITAVYSGDDTFQQNQTFTKDTASTKDLVFGTIANVNGNTTNNVEVTVRSSVVKGCADANKAVTTLSDTGIHISADGLAAHEGLVTLKLDEVYTLDAKEAYSKLLAGTDYTVQWQILSGASAHNNGGDYSSADAWVNIDGATGTTYTLTTVEQDAAYRAVITVANEPITKGSFTEIEQDANALLNGHKQYYSNVLCAADGQTTIDVLIDTNGRGTNKEGITEGETVNVNVFLSGATQATPIADVTVKIENDTAKGNNETYSTTLTGSTVNGWNVFPWNTTGVAPGFYKVTVSSKSNTGYADETVTRSLIVRESSYTIAPSNTTVTYNGRTQGLTVALNGFGFNGTGINEAANKSWTVKYYDKGNNLVEPTQAGTYKAVVTLPASAYWTEQTKTVDFTIKQRSVSIADAIAQAKVYDGTTNVSIVEVMLNDAVTDQTTNGTGLPTNNVGIINGDSIYAVATEAKLSSANAGDNSFTISTIDLRGDDAANYAWNGTAYTEDIYVSRSQVYGEHGTLELKQGETFPADKVIKMIDQSGREITLGTGTEDYTLTFYYHSDTKIEKTTDISKLGLYTVVARPNQANYKSGVTMKFEVVNDANTYTPAAEPKPSTLIDLTNTATMYNPMGNVGVTATSSQGNTVEVKYQNGTDWSTDVPANAGRYLVKATDAISGDVAYGIYTITKAHPSIGITAAEATYNSMPYTGATPDLTKATENPEHYLTYAGDVAIGYNIQKDGNVDEQAPVDAGTYTVTLHVNETANYTAHEISKSFTIAKKALTIKAKHVGAWQYGSMPGFYASYEGLAGDVNDSTPDTSLRDVQIAPELLFNPTSNNQSNYSNDALDQVGKIIIRPVDALSKNYEQTPVDGEFTKNEEDPKPTLTILGLPQNGKSADVTVYYGDEIQLSAYGNYLARRNTSSFLKWEITNSTLTNGSVSIDENNILHVNGVGTFTVKLTRGTARQAITTEITVTALKKEVKVHVADQDKVYSGSAQTYSGEVKAYDELYATVNAATTTPANKTRTDIGTQITTSRIATGSEKYQSLVYGGKFTINDKDATVAPVAQSTVYGTLETFDTTPTYKVDGNAGSVDPVTGVNVASQTDAYNRLDVHDGYEILVAGAENMNYNVKYTTDETAEDSAVTTYDGMKLYSTTTKAKNELNDATVYGEQANDLDWILDAVKSTTRDGETYADNLADFDLADTTGIFIKQDKDDCVGNAKTYKAANRTTEISGSTVEYNQAALTGPRTSEDTDTDENYTLKFNTVENSGKALLANNYKLTNVKTGNSEATTNALTANSKGFIIPATGESNDVSGENFVEGSANIAQRPIKLEKAVTDAQLYWRLPQSQLYTALVNILKAEENSVGRGLAKGHTIEDLDLSFTIGSTPVDKNNDQPMTGLTVGTQTVTVTVGDTNYKLEGGQYQFDIVLKNIQIEATYTTKTFTGFTVLIKVHNENGTITPLNDAKGLSYKIFKKTGDTIDKTTAYASGTLTYQNRTAYDDKGGLCGVFTATYPQLPLLNSGETYFIQMYEYGVELKTNS